MTLFGLGGGGSAILPLLVALGVGRIVAVDYDRVEESNLNRQFLYHESDVGELKTTVAQRVVKNLNSRIDFSTITRKIHAAEDVYEIVRGSDLAICAIDEPPYLAQRRVNAGCVAADVTCLFAGSQVTRGRLYTVVPGQSGCFDCLNIHYTRTDPQFERQFRGFHEIDFDPPTIAFAPDILRLGSALAAGGRAAADRIRRADLGRRPGGARLRHRIDGGGRRMAALSRRVPDLWCRGRGGLAGVLAVSGVDLAEPGAGAGMIPLLEIRGLAKVYARDIRANDGIDLDVHRGEVLGLLGHNGAGKTTLVRQIVGLTRPSAGTIAVDGVDAVTRPAVVRGMCSLQAQAQVPITGLTPRQAISLIGRLRGGRRHAVDRRMLQLAERLEILDWLDRPARAGDDELTGGVRRLISFCMAAVRPGKLAVLDEPTNDVDPVRRRLLWAEIRRLADDGCAVIVVTHNVAEAEHWVDRAAILHRGRVIACGPPADLAAGMLGRLRVEIGWHGSVPALPGGLAPPPPAAGSSCRPSAASG